MLGLDMHCLLTEGLRNPRRDSEASTPCKGYSSGALSGPLPGPRDKQTDKELHYLIPSFVRHSRCPSL